MNPIPMLVGDLPALQRKTFIEESHPIRSKCRRPPWPSLPLLLTASVASPRQARATRHLRASLAAQQVVNTAGLSSTDSTDRTTPSNRVRAPAQRHQPSASFAISACSLVAFILVPNVSRKFFAIISGGPPSMIFLIFKSMPMLRRRSKLRTRDKST